MCPKDSWSNEYEMRSSVSERNGSSLRQRVGNGKEKKMKFARNGTPSGF